MMIPSAEIAKNGKEALLKADFSKPMFSREYELAVIEQV